MGNEGKKEGQEIKLEQYIDQKLKSGSDIEEIKKGLLSVGWTEKQINDAIKDLEGVPVEKKPKKIKKIIIDISIAAVFILVLFFVWFNLVGKEESTICDGIPDPLSKGECYFELALENNDPNICDKYSDPNGASFCKINYAIRTNNISICNTFKDEPSFRICYLQFVYAYNDISICDNLSNFEAYPDIKISEENLSEIIDQCYLIVGEFYLLDCHTMSDDEKIEECYSDIANDVEKPKPADCEKINDNIERKACFTNIAIETADSFYCDNLKDDDAQWCKAKVFEVKEEAFSFCNNVPIPKYMGYCYIEFAKAYDNSRFCDRLAAEENALQASIDECYSVFS